VPSNSAAKGAPACQGCSTSSGLVRLIDRGARGAIAKPAAPQPAARPQALAEGLERAVDVASDSTPSARRTARAPQTARRSTCRSGRTGVAVSPSAQHRIFEARKRGARGREAKLRPKRGRRVGCLAVAMCTGDHEHALEACNRLERNRAQIARLSRRIPSTFGSLVSFLASLRLCRFATRTAL